MINLIIIPWLIAAIIMGILASNREIGSLKAFIISIIFSPLICAIFVSNSKKVVSNSDKTFQIKTLKELASKKFTNKDYEGALKNYQMIVSLEPVSPSIYFMMGSIYSIQNKKIEAFEALTKAFEQGFTDFEKLNTFKNFTYLRSQPEYNDFIKNGYKYIKTPVYSNDTIAQLERLGDLKHKGLLTDEEYKIQKSKILDL